MMTSRQKILLFSVLVVASAVILLNRLTSLYINNATIHLIFLFLAAGSLSVAFVHFVLKRKTGRATLFTLVLVAAACAAKAFFTWGGDWKTQTVAYRNIEKPSRTVETQLRGDRFNFGYRKRIVERQRIVPYFDVIRDVDTTQLNAATWKRVDEQINEIKLPGQ